MNKHFELWVGRLGNGRLSRLENGMAVCYKVNNNCYLPIAHISNNGIIKLYVTDDYIPNEDMQKIKRTAEQQRNKFLECWNKYRDIEKYEQFLNVLNYQEFAKATQNDYKYSKSLSERVKDLEEKYLFTKEITGIY
jgi:nitrate/TMAO reductase-like tetraheme cytochrome c subunit